MKKAKVRAIAFYLPQFYPTPENDEWWAPGFTEWTNVGKAKPLFHGHYQPRVPADLGYYDLRVPETREMQAQLAKEAGLEGFCYWHYWFNGRRLLDRVFREVVESGTPDFPFCLCWANHSWYAKTWNSNSPDRLLIEQTYGGVEDFTAHFNAMLPAFKDEKYIKVDGKPVFGVIAWLKKTVWASSISSDCVNRHMEYLQQRKTDSSTLWQALLLKHIIMPIQSCVVAGGSLNASISMFRM